MITDEESILKHKARRRLVGAIALTILVVVLLPMVLDSEPPAPSQDIELQIPDKDKVGEFVPKMVLPPQSADLAVSQAVSAPVIAPLLDARRAVELVPPKIEPKTIVEAKPVFEAKPAVDAQAKSEPEPKLVQAEVKAKTASKTNLSPHSGFVVQVGAFSNADAAKKLQEKLHKQGYPSYTEKSGNKTRVRVGGYASHAEAEKVRRKLEIQGMQPDVVNLN